MAALSFDGVSVTVEAAWNAGALAFAPTWTDITADVKSIQITGPGTDQDFTDPQPGSAHIELANDGDAFRLYDPTYAAGANFGRLLPRTQIRIRATYAAATYDLHRGPCTGWRQTYRQPSGSIVPLVIMDFSALCH